MRQVCWTLAAALSLGLGAGAAAGRDADRQAPGPEASAPAQSPPQLRQGEIVIKPAGKKRVVRAAAQRPARKPEVRLDTREDEKAPPPRVVSIGSFRRDASERGWGPQIHWAPYSSYSYLPYSSCSSYGTTAVPSYGYGYGHGHGLGFGHRPVGYGGSGLCASVARPASRWSCGR